MASNVVGTRSIEGKPLSGTYPVTIDLPASTGNPTEIAVPSRASGIAFTYIADDTQFTWSDAGDAAAAKTLIDLAASQGFLEAGGRIYMGVSSMNRSLYVRSNGAAVTGGLSYFFMQQD